MVLLGRGAVLWGSSPSPWRAASAWGSWAISCAAATSRAASFSRCRSAWACWFLHLYTTYATQASSLLFGNVLGVSPENLRDMLVLGVLTLACLTAIARPLVFATLDPELAEAKGVSLRLIAVLFLIVVAIAVAEAVQVVGILLVFALMVGPAAAALRCTTRLKSGIALAIALAVAETWAGIALAYVTDWPPSFWITLLSSVVYGLTVAPSSGCRAPRRRKPGLGTSRNQLSVMLIHVFIGAAVAGFVQGLSGFAFGLAAMGIWAWSVSPQLAGPMVVFGSLIGQLLSIHSVRGSLEPRRVLPFILGGVIGVPIGAAALPHLDATLFKAGVGLLLAIYCPAMLLTRELLAHPRRRQDG